MLEEMTVTVAADAGNVERHEALGCAKRIERSLQMIAEIDELGDASGCGVGEDGFERVKVAVNVRENSEAVEFERRQGNQARRGAGCCRRSISARTVAASASSAARWAT